MTNLITKATDKLSNDGLFPLLESSVHFANRKLCSYAFTTSSADQICSISDQCTTIQTEATINIEYNGIWESPHPAQISNQLGVNTINSRKFYKFSDISIVYNNFPMLNKGMKYFYPANTYEGLNVEVSPTWRQLINNGLNDEIHSDVSYLIYDRHSMDYSHWHTEVLPQLRYIDEIQTNNADLDIIFTWSNPAEDIRSWQRESLEIMGFNPEFSRNDGSIHSSELYMSSFNFLCSYMPTYPSPDDLKWVRERARQNISDRQTSFDKRVYISRQNAGRRKVVNMDEVSEVLDDFGFQIYDPGRLSFEDQIQIFSQAEIVVGPHGGGLMNMIFSDTSIIVELFANAEPRHHQFVLANLMYLDYEYLECETVDKSHDVQGHKDLMVDADDLRIILDHYIRNT